MNILNKIALIAATGALASTSVADQFHYANIIAGDRAMGLGGAYAGISDDASGVIYNPAGLGFALSNDIQGSANAFYKRTVEYEKVIGDTSYTETSGGAFAPFFGGLQKLDHIMPGASFAFAIYTSDAELKEQDDLITSDKIHRFHRATNTKASTTHFAGAFARRINSNLSLGFSLDYMVIEELTQDYQDVFQVNSDNSQYANVTLQNQRILLEGTGLIAGFGAQYAIGGNFSLGLQVRVGQFLSEKLDYVSEKSVVALDTTGIDDVGLDGSYTPGSVMSRSVIDEDLEEILGGIPTEVRLGFAWFASTRILVAMDITQFGETSADVADGVTAPDYDRESVTNFSLGAEYYVTPTIPMRFGMFSNNDARPDIDESKSGQRDHIDYMGYSLFGSLVQPNSQISVGIILQTGSGKAQKISGVTTTQDVVASSNTFAFSATHNF